MILVDYTTETEFGEVSHGNDLINIKIVNKETDICVNLTPHQAKVLADELALRAQILSYGKEAR